MLFCQFARFVNDKYQGFDTTHGETIIPETVESSFGSDATSEVVQVEEIKNDTKACAIWKLRSLVCFAFLIDPSVLSTLRRTKGIKTKCSKSGVQTLDVREQQSLKFRHIGCSATASFVVCKADFAGSSGPRRGARNREQVCQWANHIDDQR